MCLCGRAWLVDWLAGWLTAVMCSEILDFVYIVSSIPCCYVVDGYSTFVVFFFAFFFVFGGPVCYVRCKYAAGVVVAFGMTSVGILRQRQQIEKGVVGRGCGDFHPMGVSIFNFNKHQLHPNASGQKICVVFIPEAVRKISLIITELFWNIFIWVHHCLLKFLKKV